jgi:hypothetical protein
MGPASGSAGGSPGCSSGAPGGGPPRGGGPPGGGGPWPGPPRLGPSRCMASKVARCEESSTERTSIAVESRMARSRSPGPRQKPSICARRAAKMLSIDARCLTVTCSRSNISLVAGGGPCRRPGPRDPRAKPHPSGRAPHQRNRALRSAQAGRRTKTSSSRSSRCWCWFRSGRSRQRTRRRAWRRSRPGGQSLRAGSGPGRGANRRCPLVGTRPVEVCGSGAGPLIKAAGGRGLASTRLGWCERLRGGARSRQSLRAIPSTLSSAQSSSSSTR